VIHDTLRTCERPFLITFERPERERGGSPRCPRPDAQAHHQDPFFAESPLFAGSRGSPATLAALLALLAATAAHALPAGRVIRVSVPSPRMSGGARRALVYLPPSYDRDPARRYPLVILLHGGPGSCEDWFVHGHAAGTFDALAAAGTVPELIAIAPDGHGPGARGRSLWANAAGGGAPVEDFLVRDLVPWADRSFRTRPGAASRALVGLSDGADAAVRLLLRHPDVFGAAAGLSGRYSPHEARGYEAVVGPPPGRARRLRALAPLAAPDSSFERLRRDGARLYFDAGLFDLAWGDEQALAARLRARRVPFESHLYPGWHDWPFWRRRLPIALRAVVR
jgi:putative tributyrin esterase